MRNKIYSFLYFFLIIIGISTFTISCDNAPSEKQVQKDFDQFLHDVFVEEVQSDSLSLNYSLSQPDNFGISNTEVSLGTFTIDGMREGLSLTENHLNNLKSFDYDMLTKDQQLTYDIMGRYLESGLELGKFPYYNEYLGPTTGIQAQLPILLAEYNFYGKDDIDRYLELLPCVYDYFESLSLFQQEKSKNGLFMNDNVADSIIQQCSFFIEDPEQNLLIEFFDQKIDLYEGLTDEEINQYKETNKEHVLNYIIPSYEMLINNLEKLKGTGTNNGGLYNYPKGKEYYECLARFKTGSNKSMNEMISMLDSAIGDGVLEITTLATADILLLDKYMIFESFPITEPNEILNDLKVKILDDFPEPVPVECDIKYVHESLEEHLSPAMFLVPALDDYTNNNIYINGNNQEDLSMIYPTIAHEGYPGHLYQYVYFLNQNPAPIRTLMNFMGYDEGWATYVEACSYHLSGIDSNLASFLSTNNLTILYMYARADIGIHYEGWTKENGMTYIEHFFGDKAIADTIYSILLEEPGVYLPYAIGYLEIIELKNKAEEALGDDFFIKDFHEFILDIGPAQFDVIDNYLDQWILETRENN